MGEKPEGYYDGPEESMQPDEVFPEPTAQPTDDYFVPKTAEDHRKNCVAVMRRGKQQRLIFAIAKLEMIEDKYDSELETLAVCYKELKTLETAMRRSGQEP